MVSNEHFVIMLDLMDQSTSFGFSMFRTQSNCNLDNPTFIITAQHLCTSKIREIYLVRTGSLSNSTAHLKKKKLFKSLGSFITIQPESKDCTFNYFFLKETKSNFYALSISFLQQITFSHYQFKYLKYSNHNRCCITWDWRP